MRKACRTAVSIFLPAEFQIHVLPTWLDISNIMIMSGSFNVGNRVGGGGGLDVKYLIVRKLPCQKSQLSIYGLHARLEGGGGGAECHDERRRGVILMETLTSRIKFGAYRVASGAHSREDTALYSSRPLHLTPHLQSAACTPLACLTSFHYTLRTKRATI